MESLFAPRKDHRGWSTPSEAARIFFLLIMIITSIWSWNLADGNIVVWLPRNAYFYPSTFYWLVVNLVSK